MSISIGKEFGFTYYSLNFRLLWLSFGVPPSPSNEYSQQYFFACCRAINLALDWANIAFISIFLVAK